MFLPCTSVYDPANKIFHYTSYIIRSIVYLSTFRECRKVSVGFGCLTVWSGSALASLTIFEIGVGMIQGVGRFDKLFLPVSKKPKNRSLL